MMFLSASVSSPASEKIHFFPQLARDVPDEPGEALEHERDGHHAHLHDGVLHLLGDAIDDGVLGLDLGQVPYAEHGLRAPRQVRQGVLGNHHLADEIHQPVDLGLVDLQALRAAKGILGPAAELELSLGCRNR